jgi:hypothetical protein
MKGAIGTADDLVTAISKLEPPPGDEERVEKILGYLAASNLATKNAVDIYERFGSQTPTFRQYLDEAANSEKQSNTSAAVYGLQQCA